ncbi:MAG: hypothetical protein HKL96_02425 [Phycisphaerales bacterium]|nr:hypothetical protein [Phycisphaerales bacterium]
MAREMGWKCCLRVASRLSLVIAPLLFYGCASVPLRVHRGPLAGVALRAYWGTPLTGAAHNAAAHIFPAKPSDDSVIADVAFYAIKRMPLNQLTPLDQQKTLVLNIAQSHPALATGRLTSGSLLGISSQPAVEVTQRLLKASGGGSFLGLQRAAVAQGSTAQFTAFDRYAITSALNHKVIRPRISVAIWDPAQGHVERGPRAGLALSVHKITAAPNGNSGGIEAGEMQVLSVNRIKHATTYALAVPFRLLTGTNEAILAIVHLQPWSQTPTNTALYQQSKSLFAGNPSVAALGPELARPDLLEAIKNLQATAVQRSALAYLAGQTGSRLTLDIALAADNATLAQLAANESKAIGPNPKGLSLPQLGWRLDRTTFELLHAMNKKQPLPPSLLVPLSVHVGEAAWHESSLDQIARGLASRRDYRQHVIAENLIYLQDTSPASRIAAYDWLNSHGWAPAGYQPLASNSARQAALDKAENDPAYLQRIEK